MNFKTTIQLITVLDREVDDAIKKANHTILDIHINVDEIFDTIDSIVIDTIIQKI